MPPPPVPDDPLLLTDRRAAVTVAVWLGLGYVAIYLCRQNLSVAVPMLKDAFHASNEEVGSIASLGTLGYMIGKFASGPLVDRLGGRNGFLIALAGVGIFGATGALAPGIGTLALLYGANRFWGAGGWNAIMKTLSSWFPPGRIASVIALVSLSYVWGAVGAKKFAERIVAAGGDWRAVMGLPSLILLVVMVCCARALRMGPLTEIPADLKVPEGTTPAATGLARPSLFASLAFLLRRREFVILCVLSFVLTLVREAFQTWNVDYLRSLQSGAGSIAAAARTSIWFDLSGAVPILLMGFTYDRIRPELRRWLIAGILFLLGLVLAAFTTVGRSNPTGAVVLLVLAALLIYGPYSVLAGVVTLETSGTVVAGTATGLVDGIGYLGGFLAGKYLGRILDRGGYPAAFMLLSTLTFLAAGAALFLRARPPVALVTDPDSPPAPSH